MLIISLIIYVYSSLQYRVYTHTFIFLNLFTCDFKLFLNFSVDTDGFKIYVEFSPNAFSIIVK